MRHYEIVILIHPDQSDQVPDMIERYRSIVIDSGAKVHREENWGRRQLTHTISKAHKAHYVLLNIECDLNALDELVSAFRFNDAVLRHMVIKKDKPITESSLIAQIKDAEDKEDLARSSGVNDKVNRNDDSVNLTDSSPDEIEKDAPDNANQESVVDSQKEDGSD